jgi:hypothetical protein
MRETGIAAAQKGRLKSLQPELLSFLMSQNAQWSGGKVQQYQEEKQTDKCGDEGRQRQTEIQIVGRRNADRNAPDHQKKRQPCIGKTVSQTIPQRTRKEVTDLALFPGNEVSKQKWQQSSEKQKHVDPPSNDR